MALLAFAGCNRGDQRPGFTLDQSARVPDAAGVVASGDRKQIVLADGRRFGVAPDLVAFSAQDVDIAEVLPLASFRGTFVQIGLRDGKAIWVGSFGPTLPDDQGVETVYFTGRVRKVAAKSVEFQKGIVVPLDDGVSTDATAGQYVRAEIDPVTGRARTLERP